MNQFEEYIYNEINSDSDNETEKEEIKEDSKIIIQKEKIESNIKEEKKKNEIKNVKKTNNKINKKGNQDQKKYKIFSIDLKKKILDEVILKIFNFF